MWPYRRARGGVALGRRSSAAAARFLVAVRSTRRLAVSACGRWRSRFLFGAIAVALRSRRRCLRRRAGAPGAGLVISPRSRRRDDRPPLFLGGGLISRRGASRSAARSLCVRPFARSLPLWRRSPSRGAHGAAACGAALALLALAQSCRRDRDAVKLDRCSLAAAADPLGAVCRAQRLVLSACGCWLGRFLSGGGRRCAALTAPRSASCNVPSHRPQSLAPARAPTAGCNCRNGNRPPRRGGIRRAAGKSACGSASYRSDKLLRRSDPGDEADNNKSLRHSWRRRGRAAALVVAWRSAAALPRRRLAFSARYVVLGGSRSLRVVVGAVASSLEAVAVARRSRRRCLRRRAGAPGVGSAVPSRSRRREARLPLFRGGGSLFRSGASC